MKIKNLTLSILAGSIILVAGQTQAQDKTQDKTKDQTQDQTRARDQIYGSQLMTQQERIEHRNNLQNMKTQQERDAYQFEHHKRMQERAKEKGITLPDEPMGRPGGRDMRPGSGMGPGGGGMGQGSGR